MTMDKLRLEVLLSAVDKVTAPLKRIKTGSSSTATALKATRDQVKALNLEQGNITGYRKAAIEIRQQSNAIKALKANIDTQTQALDQQRAAHVNLTGNLKASKTQYNKLSKALVEGKGTTAEFMREYEKAQIKLQTAQQAFNRSATSIKTHNDRVRQGNEQLGKLSERQRIAQERLGGLRQRLDSAGVSTQNLGRRSRETRIEQERLNTVLEQQKRKLSALKVQQDRVARVKNDYAKGREFAGNAAVAGASGAATGAAVGMPILSMIKNYSSFEDAMAGVAKQVDGARDDNGHLTQTYYEMGVAIKRMSETIPMATTDIAALIEGGARMGIKGKADLLEFARVAATAATAFELPADQIGENLARIADLYKLPIKNVSQLGDAINYLDDNSLSKGADIIDVLQRTAGVTASVNMSFKDAAALGSTFLTLGSSAEIAATATNAMIRELAIATQQPKRFQEGLKAVGIEAKAVQDGMAKDATGTIQKVLAAVNKLPKSDQLGVMTQLFGKEYGDDAAKLANNIGKYREQLELVNSASGTGSMNREGAIKADQLSSRWQMNQNRLFNLSASLGETLRPRLIELIDGFNGVVETVNTWAKANPALVMTVLKAAAGIAALSAGFGVLALTMAGALGPILVARTALSLIGIRMPTLIGFLRTLATKALPMVGSALLWVGRLALANPIGAMITAIATAAYLIYSNWDQVKSYFGGLWDELKKDAGDGIGGILRILVNFSPLGIFTRAFAGVMSYFGVELPGKFSSFGGMILDGLVNGITAGMGKVQLAISRVGDNTISWFKEKLGIHSPSRVFAQLGGFTMAGLTQGLTNSEGGPLQAIAGIGKRLAQAGSFAVGVAGAGNAIAIDTRPAISARPAQVIQIAGDTNHITIPTAPGMDAGAIARAVSAELDRRDALKRARARSSLSDQD